jgi:hypothetical protein
MSGTNSFIFPTTKKASQEQSRVEANGSTLYTFILRPEKIERNQSRDS